MIRVVVFSDTHLGFDYPLRPRVERRRRGPDFFDSFQRVLDFAVAERVDLVLHTGDVFFRSKVSPLIVDMGYAALLAAADRGPPICLVPGNHDRSTLPPSLYLSHPKLHVFYDAEARAFDLPQGRVWVSAFPHQRQIQRRFLPTVERVRPPRDAGGVRLLCFHQTVAGASVGPVGYTFRDDAEAVRRDDVPGDFHAVICGHIHRHQVLATEQADLLFPGSTERTSFAEAAETKGFLDLQFASVGDDWKLVRKIFRALPTRPMQTLDIVPGLCGRQFDEHLRQSAKVLDPNSVVRLRWPTPPSASQRSWLTAARLRTLLPPTMSFELSGWRAR